MYLYGGSKGNCEPNDKVFSLDMRALPLKWDIIEQMGDVPKTRDEHTANIFENSMVIFGGFVSGVRTNEIFRYNFNSRRWDAIKPYSKIAPPARAAHSAIIYKE